MLRGHSRSSTQNVEPSFALDLTPSRPPLSLTICRTRANPKPVPFPPEMYVRATAKRLVPRPVCTLLSAHFSLIESRCEEDMS